MKSYGLFLAILCLLSFQTFAQSEPQPWGGTLVNKANGKSTFVSCRKMENDECVNFGICVRLSPDGEPALLRTVTPDYVNWLRRYSGKKRNENFKGGIGAAYFFGTVSTALLCGYDVKVACALIPVGVAVDIVKLPVVFVGHMLLLPGNAIKRLDHAKLFDFLFDQAKVGEVKKISSRRYYPFGFSY